MQFLCGSEAYRHGPRTISDRDLFGSGYAGLGSGFAGPQTVRFEAAHKSALPAFQTSLSKALAIRVLELVFAPIRRGISRSRMTAFGRQAVVALAQACGKLRAPFENAAPQPCPKPPSAPRGTNLLCLLSASKRRRGAIPPWWNGASSRPRRSTSRPAQARSSPSPPKTSGATRADASPAPFPASRTKCCFCPAARTANAWPRSNNWPRKWSSAASRWCRFPPPCWPRWTPPSAAKPALTW